ncbi:serine/threonine-protein kinase SBK1-like [Discoglossus pictus]
MTGSWEELPNINSRKLKTLQSKMYQTSRENIIDKYKIIGELGHGSFGQVLKAEDMESGICVALKLLKKEATRRKTFFQEFSISINLSDHEDIITTYNSCIETPDHYIFTQELASAGTLDSIIETEVGIPEEMVKRCAVQLIGALEYMHSRGLVHRDLKPDNVLLMDKECHQIKLSDFGLTQHVGTPVSPTSHIIPYMAPELCSILPKHFLLLDYSVDFWAFGILIYVTLTGYFPWLEAVENNKTFQEFLDWQLNGDHVSPPSCWNRFTSEAQTMFHKLLHHNPSIRSPVGIVLDYLNFPWNTKDITLLNHVVCIESHIVLEEQEDEEIIIITDNEEFNCEVIVDEEIGTMECIFVNVTEDDFKQFFLLQIGNNSLDVGAEVEIM